MMMRSEVMITNPVKHFHYFRINLRQLDVQVISLDRHHYTGWQIEFFREMEIEIDRVTSPLFWLFVQSIKCANSWILTRRIRWERGGQKEIDL